MERRRFLQSAGLGLAGLGLASTWPSFVSRAFGDDSAATAAPRERSIELAEAIARARRDGKPLLLLVIPADRQEIYQRGRVLGELINHGGSGVTDDFLLCEPACATLADARNALRIDVGAEPEPAMLLVELDGEGGEFLPTRRIALPPRPLSGKSEPEDDASVRARIAAGAAALRAVVRPTPAALARLAERNQAALAPADRASVADSLAGGTALDVALARRAAATLLVAEADGAADARPRARAALDGAAKALVATRPAGAQWARSAGCGTEIEGDTNREMVACGMGRVPELSQRFLFFYAKP